MTTYVSYAPYLRDDSPNRGHYYLYQENFLKYGILKKSNTFCLTGENFSQSNSSFLKLLKSTKLSDNIEVMENFLEKNKEEKINVHIYEGCLEDLPPLMILASKFANVKFHLNILRPSHGLATPAGSDYGKKLISQFNLLGKIKLETEINQLPRNLILTAETLSRTLLAKSLGLKIQSPIEIYSSLSGQSFPENKSTYGHHILVPYFIEDVDKARLATLLFSLRKLNLHNYTFTLLARTSKLNWYKIFLAKISRIETNLVIGNLSFDNYSKLFTSVDSVLFLETKLYNTHSSGKALDAICLRIPALTASGTYHHKIYEKWVPGIPSYRDKSDFLQCFAMWKQIHESIKIELVKNNNLIQNSYSPSRYFEDLFALFEN